jgi:hypothetical protein
MTDTHLRTNTIDLVEEANRLREEDAADIQKQQEEYLAEVMETYDSLADAPPYAHQRYEQFNQQYREVIGTAETYEEYAERWGDGDSLEVTVSEPNGDEWAKIMDESSAEAERQQRQGGSIPEGFGRKLAVDLCTTDLPEAMPADVGTWPAPIVQEVYAAIESITAPDGVDLGNESLSQAWKDAETATHTSGEG